MYLGELRRGTTASAIRNAKIWRWRDDLLKRQENGEDVSEEEKQLPDIEIPDLGALGMLNGLLTNKEEDFLFEIMKRGLISPSSWARIKEKLSC